MRFLNKLQNLESEYRADKLIAQHKQREPLVERICRYPLILNHNASANFDIVNPIEPKSAFYATRLDSKEFMKEVRRRENMPQLLDKDEIYKRHWSNIRNEQEKRMSAPNPLFNPFNKVNEERGVGDRTQGMAVRASGIIQRQANGISESRIVLYKKGQLLPPKDFFIIEISTEADSLMIAAYSVTTSESYLIEF